MHIILDGVFFCLLQGKTLCSGSSTSNNKQGPQVVIIQKSHYYASCIMKAIYVRNTNALKKRR